MSATARLAELREAFDRSFAAPPLPDVAQVENLLAIRVEADPYAVRLTAISGLFVDRIATPLPGSAPEMLGVAGFRGSIVPVYDLAALLGYATSGSRRWLVVTAEAPPIALAFDVVDGHLRVPRTAIAPATERTDRAARRSRADDVVHTPEGLRVVVDVAALRAAVAVRAGHANPNQER